jgi:hypothetical protein
MVKIVKHPDSVMVWGCFSAAGRGGLYFLPKNSTMNSETYEKFWRIIWFPSCRFTLPVFFKMGREQTDQEVFGGQGLWGDWLAGQQPWSKSHQKLLELYEGETEEQGHWLDREADQGYQGIVDDRHVEDQPQEPESMPRRI